MTDTSQDIEVDSELLKETQSKYRNVSKIVIFAVCLILALAAGTTALANHVNDALETNRNQYIENVKSTYGAESVEIIYKKREDNELILLVGGTKFTCEPPSSEDVANRKELNCSIPQTVKSVE